MTATPSSFKAYDIRGIYGDDIDADGAWRIGRAYAAWLEPEAVAVGRDMRTSAPEIAASLIEGLTSAGVRVLDIGMVATEVMYHAVSHLNLDGGIQVTASHNPAEYIGMKIVKRASQPVGIDSGLAEVRDLVVSGDEIAPVRQGVGTVEQVDVLESYREKLLSFVDVDSIKRMTVVMDAGNGLGGSMIEPLLASLPLDVHRYNFEPDGTFPNHEPNPLLPENREFIINKVKEHGADLGIAWDGDADRCFFIDDTGEFVPGDFITALLAEYELNRIGAAAAAGDSDEPIVLYDVRASRAVADLISAAGGRALPNRVGHAFIKHRMRKEGAVFAGEVSGHYYFRDFYSVDTGLVPALVLLQLVSNSGGKLSDLLSEMRKKYFISGEINSTVTDVPRKIQDIKEHYSDAKITHIDGVSVDYDDWHFNIRPSNTEPLLRLNLEADSQEKMEEKRDEVLDLIRSDSNDRVGV